MFEMAIAFLLGAVVTVAALNFSASRRERRVRRTKDGLASGANSREKVKEHTLALINGKVVADSHNPPPFFSRLFARSPS